MSSMNQSMVTAVHRWRWSVGRLLFARQGLMLAGAYGLAWGLVVLALRAVWDWPRLPMLWGLAGLPVLALLAWGWSWRRLPEKARVAAMLDGHNHAGGLYMAQAHQAGWGGHLPAITLPTLRWKGRRPMLVALAGALFVGLAFASPRWVVQTGQPRSLDVSQDIAQLNEQLQVLEQEEILPEEQAQELADKLEQVRRDADGKDPVKTWESLDHVKQQIDQASQQAAESALAQAQQMTQAQMLAEALKDYGEAFTPEQLAQAMETLEQMTQAAAQENKAFQEMLQQQAISLQDIQQLTPEQLEQLAQAMQLSKEQLQQMMEQLQQTGMLDPAKLAQMQGMCQTGKPGQGGEGQGQATAQALAQNMQGMPVESILLQLMQQGSGGISQGGGPTPMTWNENPSSPENAAFEDQVLPPAELTAIRDSQRVGVSAASPDVAKEPAQSTGGVLNANRAQGSATNQTVLPRHRAAVKNYFDRNE